MCSNTIFYDPVFIHSTPDLNIIDADEVISQQITPFVVFNAIRKKTTINLSQRKKQEVIDATSEPRQLLRCHYMPADSSIHKYDVLSDFNSTITEPTNKLSPAHIKSFLDTFIYKENLIVDPNFTVEVTTPQQFLQDSLEKQLNETLKLMVSQNLTIGGKRKTQKKHKQTNATQNSKTKKHIKKIVKYKFKLPEKNKIVINLTTQNLKNGIIYSKNENIYKFLKCYTGNTIIY
jgi:hypothetical protein